MATALRLVEDPVEKRQVLSEQDSEYRRIEHRIRQSLPSVKITGMEVVINTFLTALYELKKAEYLAKQKVIRELEVFHATEARRVDSICKENFDWRLVKGDGISFSPSADFANGHCDRMEGFERAFVVTKVMIADEEEGAENLTYPFGNNDTTTNHNGLVYVKYQDNEFLPQFVVYYECPDSMIPGTGDKIGSGSCYYKEQGVLKDVSFLATYHDALFILHKTWPCKINVSHSLEIQVNDEISNTHTFWPNIMIEMATASRKLVEDPVEKRQSLSEQDSEYRRIENWIRQSLPSVKITGMEKVVNTFLTASYELKKAEYLAKQKVVRELEVFHATAARRVDSICKNNFDWRLVFRAKFGKGSSFSPSADYTNCHCNRRNGFQRAFVVTKLMLADEEKGYENLLCPSGNNDTTTNPNGLVYVKYQDNEFLPQYVVYYECPDSMISGSQYYRNWR